MMTDLHLTDAINVPSPSGPFKTYEGAGTHTEWHGIGNGDFVNARVDPYLMRQLAMLSPPAHAQAAPWNIHGHGLQVGASLCDMTHLPANTLANALAFHNLSPTDEGANRLKLSAVDQFLRGGERGVMTAVLLQLGEPQHVIDNIDPQECTGGLPVVRSISTGPVQVANAYRIYVDQLRDLHSAWDKALSRHQADLVRQEQTRLESIQTADAAHMLCLSTQNRIDQLSSMADDVWKLDYAGFKTMSEPAKSALKMATSASKLMGILTDPELGTMAAIVEGETAETTPAGLLVTEALKISDRRPVEVRDLALAAARTHMSDLIDEGIKVYVKASLFKDPAAAQAVDMSEMPKHALTRFIAQMQPKSVDENTQPMSITLVASTVITEAKKKARADESRLNKKAKYDHLADKDEFKPHNRGPAKGNGAQGVKPPIPFQGGGAGGASSASGTGVSGGRGSNARGGRFFGHGSVASRGGGRGGARGRGGGRS
jgi:hypothetical protein